MIAFAIAKHCSGMSRVVLACLVLAGCASAHGGFGNEGDSGPAPTNDAGFVTNKDGGTIPSGDSALAWNESMTG